MIVTLLILLMPLVAIAEKVAIVPVSYTMVWEKTKSPESALIVEDNVAAGAKEAGYEVIRGTKVSKVVNAITGKNSKCNQKECLEKVAKELGVEEAIFVSVEETGPRHVYKIFFSKRSGTAGEKTGAFFKASQEIKTQVERILSKPPQKIKKTTAKQPTSVSKISDNEETTDKKLSPKAFYITATATGVFAITWGVLEIIGHSKFKNLESSNEDLGTWNDEKDKIKKLQTFDRVAMSLTMAGVITSSVLFFLTDFSKDKDNNKSGIDAIAPVVNNNGGSLMIQGRF